MIINSKFPQIGTTIFTTMSKLAIDYKAINLGQGFPDFNPEDKLINLVNKAMVNGYNQYPYMPGVAPLRKAIQNKVKKIYQADYNLETEITVTSGATEAIMATVLATIHNNDEVIIIEPSYDSYEPAVLLAGGLDQTKFKTLSCPSTFFLLADYREISDKNDQEFSIWLTQHHGVTVIPVSAFYNQSKKLPDLGLVRFCFAKQDDTLTQAVARLKNV